MSPLSKLKRFGTLTIKDTKEKFELIELGDSTCWIKQNGIQCHFFDTKTERCIKGKHPVMDDINCSQDLIIFVKHLGES